MKPRFHRFHEPASRDRHGGFSDLVRSHVTGVFRAGVILPAVLLVPFFSLLPSCGKRGESGASGRNASAVQIEREQLLLELETLSKQRSDRPVLFTAIVLKRPDLVQLALENGADPKQRHGKSLPLNEAMGRFTSQDLADRSLAIVKLLLAAGAETNVPDGLGYFPIHHAASSQNLEILKVVLKAGGRIDERTLLNEDYLNPTSGSAEALIKENARKTGSNLADGAQPIHLAASSGWVEGVRFLLEAGADRHAKDNNGGTIVGYAVASASEGLSGGRLEVVRIFEPDRQEEAPRKTNFFPDYDK